MPTFYFAARREAWDFDVSGMKFGIWLPYSSAQWVTQMARLAEQSGWDGVFLREQVVGLDRWIPIAAAALATQKILIGGVISPASNDVLRSVLNEAYRIHHRSGQRLVVCLGKWYQEDMLSDSGTGDSKKPLTQGGTMWEEGEDAAWLAQRLVVWRLGILPDQESIIDALGHQGVIPVIRQRDRSIRAPSKREIKQLGRFIQQTAPPEKQIEIVIELAIEEYEPKALFEQAKDWETAGATWCIIHSGNSMNGAQGMRQLQELILLGPPC